MKVLLIAYHFPPDAAVGALRAAKVADALVARGHEVEVIAGETGVERPDDRYAALRVHRVPSRLDPRRVYAGLKRAIAGRGADTARPGERLEPAEQRWAPPEQTPFWKRQLSAVLWLPDDRQGWVLPVVSRARPLIRAGCDLVYTTAPPHSTHLAGWLLKRMTGVRWIEEFRDPWADNPWKPAFVRTAWSDAADRWLERRCLRRADTVVTVTRSLADELAKRMGGDGTRGPIVVRNGIDSLEQGRVAKDGDAEDFSVVYVGNLYHNRDPRPFFDAIGRLRARDELPARLRIDFIGDCHWFQGRSVSDIAAQSGIAEFVHIERPVPHAESLRRIADADLLLLLAQDQPKQVPNKLYEYLGTRRPILAFVDARGESARMLRRVGGHAIIESAQPEEIAAAVRAALRRTDGPTGDVKVLEEWTTASQMERLVECIESSPRDRAGRGANREPTGPEAGSTI